MSGIMACGCLPHKIFGTDTDELLAYTTPRVVKINDRALGIINYILMIFLFIYICIFMVYYQGKHFKEQRPDGVYRVQWQEPTKGCNPFDLDCEANYGSPDQLKYCSQSGSGNHPCGFYDARELPITLAQGVMIPTYIETFKQIRACSPETSHCKKKWQFVDEKGDPQKGSGGAKPVRAQYVTDAGKFTMLIDHSFRADGGEKVCKDLSGAETASCNDYVMQGIWATCKDGRGCEYKDIACRHDKCDLLKKDTLGQAVELKQNFFQRNRTRAHRQQLQSPLITDLSGSLNMYQMIAEEQSKGVLEPFAIGDGDIFSLERLYEMSGRSFEDPADETGNDPATIRERGGVLILDISYKNKKNWRLKYTDQPWYIVKVTSRKVSDFKHFVVKHEDDNSREIVRAYGTYIIISQNGKINTWNIGGVFGVIGASVGLIMLSAKITDFLLTQKWLFVHAEDYTKAKFKKTRDFHGHDGEAAHAHHASTSERVDYIEKMLGDSADKHAATLEAKKADDAAAVKPST